MRGYSVCGDQMEWPLARYGWRGDNEINVSQNLIYELYDTVGKGSMLYLIQTLML